MHLILKFSSLHPTSSQFGILAREVGVRLQPKAERSNFRSSRNGCYRHCDGRRGVRQRGGSRSLGGFDPRGGVGFTSRRAFYNYDVNAAIKNALFELTGKRDGKDVAYVVGRLAARGSYMSGRWGFWRTA